MGIWEVSMGRSVLPLSQVIQEEFRHLKAFRRALDRESRAAFDQLYPAAKYHQAAMVYAARAVPLDTILLGILVEQQKAIARLAGAIDGLEAR